MYLVRHFWPNSSLICEPSRQVLHINNKHGPILNLTQNHAEYLAVSLPGRVYVEFHYRPEKFRRPEFALISRTCSLIINIEWLPWALGTHGDRLIGSKKPYSSTIIRLQTDLIPYRKRIQFLFLIGNTHADAESGIPTKRKTLVSFTRFRLTAGGPPFPPRCLYAI